MATHGRVTGFAALLPFAVAGALGACGQSGESPATKQEVTAETPQQIIARLQQQAQSGDAKAQLALGERYLDGIDIEKNSFRALEWFKKSAEQGNPDAQYKLGRAYGKGIGVAKDAVKAVEWYQKAADNGNADGLGSLGASYSNGDGVRKDEEKGFRLIQEAAEKGSPHAQGNLGAAYALGLGTEKNVVVAVEWFKKGAAQGDSHSQMMLAYSLMEGAGVPKDEVQSAEWLRKAAVQGNADAQQYMAWMYKNGKGVPADAVLAYAWSNLAASNGNQEAVENRRLYENHLTAPAKAEAERLASNWKKGGSLTREDSTVDQGDAITSGGLRKFGTGTGFLVSKIGQVITNHHVVNNCKELRVQGHDGIGKLVAQDRINDLALIQIQTKATDIAVIASEAGRLRQGEEIVAFGFPLNSVLSTGGNLTPGVVSALTGLGNNTNQIQITAPIQPGSSGSPVINKKGEVVGVVSLKLDDKKMAKLTGQLGQNINFAVNTDTLRSFLNINEVNYNNGAGFWAREKSTADLADEARKWTMVIECWK